MKKEITTTPYYSKKIGKLPKGCQMCVRGEKLVLYITGICPRSCWYCPLSERRKDKDVIYANEWKIEEASQMFEEADMMNAKGAGITGGDPLAKVDRTVEYIKVLKEKYGKEFHIHLYTTFVLSSSENMKKLYEAGLDEIRFHPDFEKKEDWNKIENARKFDWEIGLEIPGIPKLKKEIFEMIDFFNGKVKFLNVNELEVSELNMDDMEKYNYVTKTDISHGVLGSDSLGDEVLKYCLNKDFNVHYCSSKLKDKVQMTNRFKRRAKNVATKFDTITDEGLLLRGVIYLKELVPGIDFKEKLKNMVTPKNTRSIHFEQDSKSLDKKEFLNKLKKVENWLVEEGLEVLVDEKKFRIITYPEHVEQFAQVLKDNNLIPAIVEEDPTVEAFELNRDFL